MAACLYLLVFAVCVAESLFALKDIRGQSIRLMVFSTLGLIHGIVPAITPDEMTWASTDQSVIDTAAVLTLAGIVMFSIGWRYYERTRRTWDGISPGLLLYIESIHGKSLLVRMFLLSAIASILAWLAAMVITAGSVNAAFAAGRFEYRGIGNVYLRSILSHVANLMPIPGFICFFMSRTFRIAGITFAITMSVLLFVSSHGGRAETLGILGSLAIGYTLQSKITFHRAAVLGASFLVIGLLSISLYEVRKTMSQSTLGDMAHIVTSIETYEGALGRDPLNYHQFFTAAIEHFPRDHPYLNGATYLRLAVFFLPRKYFPNIKPPDTNNTFAKAITSPYSLATIPPTMMGDGYINFWGPPGVLGVMLLNGVLFATAARRIRESFWWFLSLGQFARLALMMFRGSPYEVMTLLLTTSVFVYTVAILSGTDLISVDRQIRTSNNGV